MGFPAVDGFGARISRRRKFGFVWTFAPLDFPAVKFAANGKTLLEDICNLCQESMRSLENRRGAGRPTVDKDTLSSDRDALVWLLSVFWGEIGWEVPRSTSSEELRQAFGPVRP